MQDISWLESLATMTDFDIEVDALIKAQSMSIQQAYRANDQSVLKSLIGRDDKLACKTTIFQL